jgi:hypothetical protein
MIREWNIMHPSIWMKVLFSSATFNGKIAGVDQEEVAYKIWI